MTQLSRDAVVKAWNKESKRIRDRERRFQAMPQNRQRVAIAKDVLDSLDAKRIKAKRGTYTNLNDKIMREYDEELGKDIHELDDMQLQEVLPALPACSACAIGSVFLCAVTRNNDITVGKMDNFNDDRLMLQYLRPFFSEDMLREMESAFEQDKVNDENLSDLWRNIENDGTSSPRKNAAIFGTMFNNPTSRMRAIMQNIIDNDGEFNPNSDERFVKRRAKVWKLKLEWRKQQYGY